MIRYGHDGLTRVRSLPFKCNLTYIEALQCTLESVAYTLQHGGQVWRGHRPREYAHPVVAHEPTRSSKERSERSSAGTRPKEVHWMNDSRERVATVLELHVHGRSAIPRASYYENYR